MPVIQASTIRSLSLGVWEKVSVDPRGIRISGARIVGDIDLFGGNCNFPIALVSCHIPDKILIQHTQMRGITLSGSILDSGIVADGASIHGNIVCDGDFCSLSQIRLIGASISGYVHFRDAQLQGNGDTALLADGVRIGRSILCNNEFRTSGQIRLIGATIGGDADFDGASLEGNGAPTIFADGAVIEGNLFCRNGFNSAGEIRLLGARIGGNVEFNGSRILSPFSDALSGDGILVNGDIFFHEEFSAVGKIRLPGAEVRGNMDFRGANLTGSKDSILYCSGIHVKGNTFFSDGFEFSGNVDLTNSFVEGLIDWRPSGWNGELNLSHAKAGLWADKWNGVSWNCDIEREESFSNIDIRDFRFSSFLADDEVVVDAALRVKWLEAGLKNEFFPGPYENLIRVLRMSGDDDGANRVALEKRRARSRHVVANTNSLLPRFARRLWSYFLDITIGHGYQAWRGGVALVLFLFIGWLVFWFMGPTSSGGHGIVKPSIAVAFMEDLNRRVDERPLWWKDTPPHHGIQYSLPPEYPPFSPFWYSLDTLLPLVDIGQASAWAPSPIHPSITGDLSGWAVTIYLYIHIIAGWVLSTLTLVALSGVIRREDGRRSE